jgi:hypothetical protein
MSLLTLIVRVKHWRVCDLDHVSMVPHSLVKRYQFSLKGKSSDTIYNAVDHESNPSHYQLSAGIMVIHRRFTSYKALQHWLTHLLHRLI